MASSNTSPQPYLPIPPNPLSQYQHPIVTGKSFSMQRKLSVLPIVLGVSLAFYGGRQLHATLLIVATQPIDPLTNTTFTFYIASHTLSILFISRLSHPLDAADMSFTAVGAFYTFFCVILAALKAVMGGELLTVHPHTHSMHSTHSIYSIHPI